MPRQAQDPDPVSLIAHYGSELRTLRDEAGLSRPQLGEVLGYTGQWIGQVELTRSMPSEQFSIDLDTYFKTGGLFFRLWRSIKRASNRRVLLPGFPRYLELEAEAVVIRAFVTQLIPGLLQFDELNWRKSSRSGQGGQNCVELAGLPGAVAVRDSKNPDGPKLAFARAEWVAFIGAIKQSA